MANWYLRYEADPQHKVRTSHPGSVTDLMAGQTVTYDNLAALAIDLGFTLAAVDVTSAPYLATGLGVADDTLAIQTAITAATAAGLGIYFPPGTYNLSSTLVLNANRLECFGCGQATILKAQSGFTGSAMIQVGANEGGAPRQHAVVKNLILNANAKGVDGVVCYKAQNLTLENLNVQTARNGFFFDGQYDVRILNVLLRSCYTTGCTTAGYKFAGSNPVQNSSFDTFLLESCASESDATSLYALGVMQNRITLVGCELQNASVAGIHADGTTVSLIGTYIETSNGATAPAIQAVNGATVMQDGASSAAYPSVDATSRLLVGAGANISVNHYQSPAVIGVSDTISGAVQLWGPPNYPQDGRAGTTSYLGQIYTDPQGIRWMCTLAGTTAAPPYSRWDAMDGEVRIPVDLTTLANGSKFWAPQNDFILEAVDLLVTTTGASGTYISIGTDNVSVQQSIVSQAQGAVANLVAGKVVSAWKNAHGTALLAPVGTRAALQGTEFNGVPAAGNYLGYIKSGTFSAGAATLIIRGRYPQSTRGTVAIL